MPKIKLGKKLIEKESSDCFIIAEAGTNYYEIADRNNISPLKAAYFMIEMAAFSGADAIKFQTYKAEKLTSDISDIKYFKKYDKLDYDDYFSLAERCKKTGLEFMTTLFDEEAVEVLGPYLNIFKIASPDITYKSLITKIAKFNKPVLLSTGASTVCDINRAIKWIESDKIVLLHCVASYPTALRDLNLLVIRYLNNAFPYMVGYSDHSIFDINVLTTAYLLGANVIEKHFTCYSDIVKNDHLHSMQPLELVGLVSEINKCKAMLGNNKKNVQESEKPVYKNGRRSTFLKKGVKKGEKIMPENLTYLRPGTGIPPYIDIVNEKVRFDLSDNQMLHPFMLEWKDSALKKS